ncbi:hypothetical protein KDJ56_11660 [Brevibacillus composti]|uniref:Uncharacterized protein n=1 Tax=Brevibacillus composti TaxID=2796470 RepID=A0A7T5EHC1_9BACL|nr:hypothetical protein [Brevibacillus composti]QQE72637.1 hypothetical protein JD108_11715 [Brevibacillus composti]QUO39715.1 hypothetical protein KDJ56_11660 [Brevibacillus composti]
MDDQKRYERQEKTTAGGPGQTAAPLSSPPGSQPPENNRLPDPWRRFYEEIQKAVKDRS